MLDIRFIRDNAQKVQLASTQKGYKVDIAHLLELDDKRRELLASVEEVRQARNTLAAGLKTSKPTDEQIAHGKKLKTTLTELEDRLQVVEIEYITALKKVPNMPLENVPVGTSEDENIVVKTWGEKPNFTFEPKNHWQIAEQLDLIDKERAAKVAGARFAYLKGDVVKLQFALMQFVTATLTDQSIISKIVKDNNLGVSTKPFVPVLPPAVIKTDVYEATARLDSEEVTYKLADDELWLNASAEHSMCPMYKDEIIPEVDLPIRYIAYATSFRREAGTYGKDMEGIFRMHQFDKLEMESFSVAEQGLEEHRLFVAIQEHLLQQLVLPYQVLQKCTADIGGPNATGIDINTWLPGQGKYRETHTADYITDYQARRLQTRVRRHNGKLELIHTNDATAFALGRILIAIIENYQQADGNISIPKVLEPYMH